MADYDHPNKNSPRNRLLDELESIKDLLDRNGETDADTIDAIPVLSDVVAPGELQPHGQPQAPMPAAAEPGLFNLDSIFDEDDLELADDDIDSPVIAPAPAFQFPRFTLDVAISDEMPGQGQPAPSARTTPPIAVVASPPAATAPAPLPLGVTPSPVSKPEIAAPATPVPAPVKRVRPDYSREVLIQELVDEFIPQIEAELRQRLSEFDIDTLRDWQKKL